MWKNAETVEFGVLYPAVKGGELDRVLPCSDEVEAIEARDSFLARNITCHVISRKISSWRIVQE